MGDGDVRYRPPKVNPCENCRIDLVVKTVDGLTEDYHCEDCGDLLATLAIGAEP